MSTRFAKILVTIAAALCLAVLLPCAAMALDAGDTGGYVTVAPQDGDNDGNGTVGNVGNDNGDNGTGDEVQLTPITRLVFGKGLTNGYAYNGTARELPVSSVKYINAKGKEMTVPRDYYDVTYKNNINAGKATVIVTAKGPYTGTLTETYTIHPKSLTYVQFDAVPDQVYNKKGVTPTPKNVKVKIGDSYKKLVKGKDYKIVYKNNKKIGTATFTIKGIGNYTDSRSGQFDIVKNQLVVTKKSNDITFAEKGTGWVDVSVASYGTLSGTAKNPKVITFKKGNYLVPCMTIGSYVTIKAEKGVVFRSKSTGGYFVGGETAATKSKTGYTHLTNVKIIGGKYTIRKQNKAGSTMKFSHAKNITLKDFQINNCYGTHFIEFVGVYNSTISNVTLTGAYTGDATNEAIQLDNAYNAQVAPNCEPFDGTPCSKITISNCTINVPNMPYGIGTNFACNRYSTYITVQNCNITSKTNTVRLMCTDHCTVKDNVFHKTDMLRSHWSMTNFAQWNNKFYG